MNERATIAGLAYGADGLDRLRAWAVRARGRSDQQRACRSPRPPDEEAALRAALVSAGQQIAKLAEAVGGEAAQILEFQVALLEDDEFLDPIFAAIVEATPAHTAWSSALEAQIAGLQRGRRRVSPGALRRTWRICVIASSAPYVAVRVKRQKFRRGAVVCADDLPPSQFLEIDWSRGGGLALLRGSPTSHVAMLARARGIPMIVQLGSVPAGARTALLDGEGATLELDPSAEQIGLFERRRDLLRKNRASARAILRRPTASWAGEKIAVADQIQRVEDLEHADAQYADGIGLMRTEFLLGQQAGLPDEEMQYRAYDAVLRWAGKRPVTIRTFDAGGDKPVARIYRRRRGQSVPRRARLAALSCASRHLSRSAAGAGARGRARESSKSCCPWSRCLRNWKRLAGSLSKRSIELQSEGIPAGASGNRHHGRGARGCLGDRTV